MKQKSWKKPKKQRKRKNQNQIKAFEKLLTIIVTFYKTTRSAFVKRSLIPFYKGFFTQSCFIKEWGWRELNPHASHLATDFKSVASTNSATSPSQVVVWVYHINFFVPLFLPTFCAKVMVFLLLFPSCWKEASRAKQSGLLEVCILAALSCCPLLLRSLAALSCRASFLRFLVVVRKRTCGSRIVLCEKIKRRKNKKIR